MYKNGATHGPERENFEAKFLVAVKRTEESSLPTVRFEDIGKYAHALCGQWRACGALVELDGQQEELDDKHEGLDEQHFARD